MLPEDLKTRLKKPIAIATWGRAERYSWDVTKASANLSFAPGYIDPSSGDASWFGGYDSLDTLPGYYYAQLSMKGWVFSDRDVDCLTVEDARYRDVHELTPKAVKMMGKTYDRLEKRIATWRYDIAESTNRWGAEAELRAFCYAINADRVWLIEGQKHTEGRLVDVDQAIQWINKKASDLALQCRIITGQHQGTITAYTSAPENFDGFSSTTVQWLPYTDHIGRRYRKISLEGRDWQWQLGRNFSGLFGLFQEHEFEALKPTLKPWEETEPATAETVE